MKNLKLSSIFLATFFFISSYPVSGSEPNKYSKVISEMTQGANNGGILEQVLLGITYYQGEYEGEYVKQDYFKAFEWFRKAAAQEDFFSQRMLGLMYDEGKGVKQDYFKAFEWFRKAAAQGDPLAQLKSGLMYYHGKGVKQDYFKAFEWFRKAAAQDEPISQAHLGLMYKYGKGVKQDHSEAKKWYGKSCDNKNQSGCNNYADLNK